MDYESSICVESKVMAGVRFLVDRMSFARRMELMRKIRELAGRVEFLEASSEAGDKMSAGLLRAEVDRLYLIWGLREIVGLRIDSTDATAELLIERGPEELFREALEAVKWASGLHQEGRKN